MNRLLTEQALAHQQAEIAAKEADIDFLIHEFEAQRGAYTECTSTLEMDADCAGLGIKRAQKRIRELMVEIEHQEKLIRDARRVITRFRKSQADGANGSPGRPPISESSAKQWRHSIARKFVAQWVKSLQDCLSVETCGELARLTGKNKMTWSRWLNEDELTLPYAKHLELLLNEKIRSGNCKGTALSDIQTHPSLTNLIRLVELA